MHQFSHTKEVCVASCRGVLSHKALLKLREGLFPWFVWGSNPPKSCWVYLDLHQLLCYNLSGPWSGKGDRILAVLLLPILPLPGLNPPSFPPNLPPFPPPPHLFHPPPPISLPVHRLTSARRCRWTAGVQLWLLAACSSHLATQNCLSHFATAILQPTLLKC